MVASASVIASGECTGVAMLPQTLPERRAIAAAMHIFSNTVSEGKICATWNEREMPSRVISRDALAGDLLVLEPDAALGGREMAGDHVDEGGLACTVGADHADGLLGRHADGDVARGHQRAKSFFQIADGENVAHDFASPRRLSRATTEPRPSGRNRMVSSRTDPSVICHSCGMTSKANERTPSNTSEPTKAAATEPAPARMVTKTKPPDVVQ